ncbi:MAG: N-acetyltransferase [Rhizobiaceae bacterium]
MISFSLPGFRKREFIIGELGRDDSPAMARLHEEGFSRPWSDGEFAQLLAQDQVFGFAARIEGAGNAPPAGFVLARLAAGEAEILTLCVAKSHRRAGLGRRLLDAVLRSLHAARAEELFLEVDETNAPALALYRRLGFQEKGRRPGYYAGPDGKKSAALVMRLDLR